MRPSSVIACIFLALSTLSCQASEPPIRKATSSGICHDPSSPNYEQIKDYLPYATMEACIASGGRARKPLHPSDDLSFVKKSRSDICYDSSNGRFTEIVNFTAYKTIEDCIADGGRRP